MISLEQMTDAEFERHALSLLQRELGLDGLARFLRVCQAGNGDYTRDRHRWLEGVTVDRGCGFEQLEDAPEYRHSAQGR